MMPIEDVKSTAPQTISLQPYKRDLFVNRAEEIESVKEKIEQIQTGKQTGRVMAFRDERGAGKTWLTLHLHHTIIPQMREAELTDAKSFLIGLQWPVSSNESSYKNEYHLPAVDDQNDETAIGNILRQMGKSFSEFDSYPASATRFELTEWLIRDLRRWHGGNKDRVFVLLVDSVFESDWDWLKGLESALLKPLIELPFTLIVMTGRGPVPAWRSSDIYVKADDYRKPLTSFDDMGIDEIVASLPSAADIDENQSKKIIEEIQKFGSGNPLVICFLANILASTQITTAALAELLRYLLEPYMIETQEFFDYFQALSPLQDFREWEMGRLLKVFYDDSAYENDQERVRAVRDVMLATHLVDADESGRFKMNEAVRLVAEKHLRSADIGKFYSLHKAAYDLYGEYTTEDPWFQTRVDYHKKRLEEVQPAPQ